MNFWISFAAGLVLMSLDLWGLSLVTSRLGRGTPVRAVVYLGYAALEFLKLAVLGAGIFLLVRSPYFQFGGLFLGLGLPVAYLAVRQVMALGKQKA